MRTFECNVYRAPACCLYVFFVCVFILYKYSLGMSRFLSGFVSLATISHIRVRVLVVVTYHQLYALRTLSARAPVGRVSVGDSSTIRLH